MTNLPSETPRRHWASYLLIPAWFLVVGLIFAYVLSLLYFLVRDAIPNWREAWALLASNSFGFANLSRNDAAYLRINGNYLLWNAGFIAAAFPLYWISARFGRRDPARRLRQLERTRPFQAIFLLFAAFGLMPFTLITFLANTVRVQQGILSGESEFFGAIFSSFWMPVLMFLIFSGVFHGARPDIENDELIRQQRGKAVQAGYWAMIVGAAVTGLGVMVSPLWQMAALPLVLYLGLAVAMVHFAVFLLRSGGAAEA